MIRFVRVIYSVLATLLFLVALPEILMIMRVVVTPRAQVVPLFTGCVGARVEGISNTTFDACITTFPVATNAVNV